MNTTNTRAAHRAAFCLSKGVQQMSANDLKALNSLPGSIATADYSEEERAILTILYKTYIEPIKPLLFASYRDNAQPYMTTGRKPGRLQAMHHILLWYAYFQRTPILTAIEAAELFYAELEQVSDERAELLKAMFSPAK